MRSGPKNLVSKVLRCALGLALRSGYTSLVVSTGKVRHKAQRSGLGTKGEVRLRIIWVKDWVVSFVSLTEEVAAAILAVRETLAGL